MTDRINRAETLRCLGNKNLEPDERMIKLLDECEKEFLAKIKPAYLYKKVELKNSDLIIGEDIKKHLEGCRYAVIFCATVGLDVDKLIRVSQITDMPKAVVFDAMASVAVEDLCDKVEKEISAACSDYYTTWRYSPGYGDYPIELQKKYLTILDAQKKIGLCVSDSFLLTPTKSVTAIMGLSEIPVNKKRSSCFNCNLVKTCKFRKAGTRCEF